MRKGNGAEDPWCKRPVETVDIDGVKVTVRGLSIGELHALNKEKKDDVESSLDVVIACCVRSDGIPITQESALNFRPEVMRKLNDVVARVNGFDAGNLSATVGGGSSSE